MGKELWHRIIVPMNMLFAQHVALVGLEFILIYLLCQIFNPGRLQNNFPHDYGCAPWVIGSSSIESFWAFKSSLSTLGPVMVVLSEAGSWKGENGANCCPHRHNSHPNPHPPPTFSIPISTTQTPSSSFSTWLGTVWVACLNFQWWCGGGDGGPWIKECLPP